MCYTYYGKEVRIYCKGDPASAVFLGRDWHCLSCGEQVAVVL